MTVAELLAKMPDKIRVGTQEYTVSAVSGLTSDEGEVNGLCEPQHLRIGVDDGLVSKALVVDTLFHEVLHAIWDERSLPNKPNEERAVRSLATGIVGLFQDNPKLLTWIKQGLK